MIPTGGGGDATMSVVRANLVALAWLPISAAFAAAPYVLRWGTGSVGTALQTLPSLPLGIALLATSVLAHELLHAAGFRLVGRAPRSAVRIGFQRRTLTPFASCSAPVPVTAYRVAALLPGAVLGLVPLAVSWVSGSGALLIWGWLMLALAGGDLAAVWAIRGLPRGTLVLDHPELVGCRALGTPPARSAASTD